MTPREWLKRQKFFLKGVSTLLPPFMSRPLPQHQHQFCGRGQRAYPGSMDVARAYYSVWMRLLIFIDQTNVNYSIDSVGEIGPGDSLATGLAAILSGARRYVALDIVPTVHNFPNEEVFEDLVYLFETRADIPNQNEQPKQRPYLSSYSFPKHILSDERMAVLLDPKRLNQIRHILKHIRDGERVPDSYEIKIEYEVPWWIDTAVARRRESLDLIISNATMEHVDDVPRAYRVASQLLKRSGILASVIDYKCHDTAGFWNGHWTYSSFAWKVVRGKCAYFINRWTHSMHLDELKNLFEILNDIRFPRTSILKPWDIAFQFRQLPEEDFKTAEGVIIARKE